MNPEVDRLISVKEVAHLTTLSRTALWRLEKDGKFPDPTSLVGSRLGKGLPTMLNAKGRGRVNGRAPCSNAPQSPRLRRHRLQARNGAMVQEGDRG